MRHFLTMQIISLQTVPSAHLFCYSTGIINLLVHRTPMYVVVNVTLLIIEEGKTCLFWQKVVS